ncbi:MAG: T9SS type A sorting domain-containing protein [Bacteroidota bacterium]
MSAKLYRMVVFLLLLLPMKALSQDLVIDDWYTTTRYLNAIIATDTASAAFKAGTRVYVLHKDGIYAWNASLDYQPGRTVTFRAAYEHGNYGDFDPIIYFYPTATGGGAVPGQMSQLASNVTLRMTHIMIAGYNEQQDSLLKYSNTMMIRTLSTSSNTRIYLDSCVMKTIAGQIIRTEGPVAVIKVTNSTFADMGHPTSNFGAGKFIDARNVRVDSLIIQNCTFVNLYDRVIRHYQATNPNSIRNFIFDHNTVLYDMSYHGFLSLGTVDTTGNGTLQITNNLFIDHFALGMDTAAVRQVEFSDPGENDPTNGLPRMTWVMTNKNDIAKWNIQKNYYASSDSGAAMLALGPPNDNIYAGPFYHKQGPPYLTLNMNKILASQGKDTLNTFIPVSAKVTKAPGLMTELIRWVLNKSLDNKNKPTLNVTANWSWTYDFHRHHLEYYADTLDCSYTASLNLAAAGTDGKVIGDARWKFNGVVAVGNPPSDVPGRFALDQNYPNPFNPSTKLSFSLGKPGYATLTVYNILGQKVATPIAGILTVGYHELNFDASKLPSGVYFYRLDSGKNSDVKKMMLLR